MATALALVGGVGAVSGCAVAVVGSPAPATGAPAALAADRFTDPGGRFSLVAPYGWPTDTSGRQATAVAFVSPRTVATPAGPFAANVNVVVVANPGTAGAPDLDAVVAGARRELRGLPAYAALQDEPTALADGRPAHLLGGTFTQSGFAVRNLQIVVVGSSATVVVTGTGLAADWALVQPVLAASLHTLAVPG